MKQFNTVAFLVQVLRLQIEASNVKLKASHLVVTHMRSPLNSVVMNCATCLWFICPTTSNQDTTRNSAMYDAILGMLKQIDTQQHLQQLRRGCRI